MKAPAGPIGKERACTIDRTAGTAKISTCSGPSQSGAAMPAWCALAYRPISQPRRESVNCAPESEVQLSWLGLTRAQLTLDWVLRTSEVMLISTRVGEVLI